MNIRDTIERLFWTVLAAFLGGLTVGGVLDISTLDAAALAGASAGVNFLLIIARSRLAVLPEPGEGLPGLPTDDAGQSVVVVAAVAACVCLVLLFAFDLI